MKVVSLIKYKCIEWKDAKYLSRRIYDLKSKNTLIESFNASIIVKLLGIFHNRK